MAIEAAKLRILVEVDGTSQATRDLNSLGQQIANTGQVSDRATSGVNNLGKSTQDVGNRARDASGRFVAMGTGAATAGKGAESAGKSVTGLGGALGSVNTKALLATAGIAGIGVGAMQAGQQIVGSAIAWEDAFAGVEKTTDGTAAQMAELEAGIRQMAMSMPIAAVEIAGVAEAAGQLGVAQEDILEFSRVTSLIGVTTNVSADQAATSLGQLSNVLGLTSQDYERFASSLIAVGNAGSSTEADVLSITTRIGAATKLIGFSTDETLGWAAAVANLGLESQAAGGAVQSFALESSKLIHAGAESLDVMASTANMTADAFQQAFAQDSNAALQSFIEGLGDLDQAQQLATLSALGFNDINITRTILGLANSNTNLADSLDTTATGWQENNAMQIEAQKRFDTTASRIQTARNRLQDVSVTIGTEFLPAVAGAAEGAADFALGLRDVATHLTSSSSLDALDRWTEAMDQLGASDTPFPEPPEETGVRWGHFVSDMVGHDWGSLWGAFEAPDDIMNDFDMPLPELASAEHRAALQEVIDSYGNLRPEMGGVTEAQRDQAVVMLQAIDAYKGVVEQQAELQRQGMTGTETMQHNTDAWQAQQEAATLTAEAWFSAAEAQTSTSQRTAEQTEAWENQLTVMSDLESGHGAYMGQLSATEQMQHDASLAGWALNETLGELAGAYDASLESMAAFNSQSSEYAGAQNTIEEALEGVQEKVAAGIELSEEEQLILDHGTAAIERYVGGQEDAEKQAALHAIAAGKVMEAQDALNSAIERGEEDLGPYQQALKDAETFMGDMEGATGNAASAQDILTDTINTNLIGAIDNLTRKVEYISKPWLMQIDAATEAAETEINRIRDMIANQVVYMPVQIAMGSNEWGGPEYAAGGTVPSGGQLAKVGEEGWEYAWLPGGTQVFPHHESVAMEKTLGAGVPGYALGTADRPDLTRGEETALSIVGNLEVMLDPESIAEAEAELAALWDARAVAESLGMGEAVIAEIDDQIRTQQQELDLIGHVAGTDIGQGIIAGINEEIASEAAGVARAALEELAEGWDAEAGDLFDRYGTALGDDAAQVADRLAEQVAEMDAAIQMAMADGASRQVISRMETAREEVAAELALLEGDIAAGIEAGLIAVEEAIPINFEKLESIFSSTPELVDQFIDDIVMGLADGALDFEQAMSLLGQSGTGALGPELESIEKQLTVDLVNAIIAGNAELEADIKEKLALLGQLQGELGETHEDAARLSAYYADNQGQWRFDQTAAVFRAEVDKMAPIQGHSGDYHSTPAMADGGIITSPLLGLVGEAGPEMVQPLSSGHPERDRFISDVAETVISRMGGGQPIIIDMPLILDGQVFGRATRKVMNDDYRNKL